MLLKLDNLTRNVRLSEVLRTWIEFFYSCFLVGTSLSKTRYKWVSFFSRTLWIGLFCRGSKSPLSFFVVSFTCNVLKSPLSFWSVSKSIIQYDQQVRCRFRPPFPRFRRVVGLILIKIVVSKPVACQLWHKEALPISATQLPVLGGNYSKVRLKKRTLAQSSRCLSLYL